MDSGLDVDVQTTPDSSLPLYLTRFVGREEEITNLTGLLESRRLLTLIGPGGIGKTRLALQVAGKVASTFADGVFLIEFGSIIEGQADSQLLAQVITTSLGIATESDKTLLPLLISALEKRHLLLLLDNCEHLLAECAPLAETLLQNCPRVQILATSREPLALPGELVWRVGALSLPAPEIQPALADLTTYDAVQLFCERAIEHTPRFRLTEHNASTVVQLCRQLDGLPLALELACALLPMISVEQLTRRLREQAGLPGQGTRATSTRQQTLQATLDWSFSLLTPIEQTIFMRLAIFAGSWSLDAVEQICTPQEISSTMIFDVLVRLVNKSLVIAEEQEAAEDEQPEIRYRLLHTIQQYAQEKLRQAGIWEMLCMEHAKWYLQLAEQASPHLHGADYQLWLQWLQCLEMESTNLQAALGRLLTSGHLNETTRLADALRRFWIAHNHFSEGRYWFDTLLDQQRREPRLSPQLHARALFGAAEFARYQAAYDRSYSLLEEECQLLSTLDDPQTLAEARVYLALVIGLRGDFEQGIQLCQASLASCREQRNHRGMLSALLTQAFLTLAQGDFPHAITLSEEACKVLRAAGNHNLLLYALFIQAQAALFQRAKVQACAICQEALRLAIAQGQAYGIAASLGLIGGLADLEGQPIIAARLFGAAQALQDRVQTPHPPAGRALQERMILSVRAALGADQFIYYYTEGKMCTLEQMIYVAESILQQANTTTSRSTATPTSFIPETDTALSTLSRREREILVLVTAGLTDAQIAQHLVLSPRTIGKHLQSTYAKLHINSRSAATRFALEHGLL